MAVLVLEAEDEVVEVDALGWIKGVRMDVAWDLYALGSVNGDGQLLDDGHSSVYPAANCGSGVTRKLKLDTAF
jgi:hypothetical protein